MSAVSQRARVSARAAVHTRHTPSTELGRVGRDGRRPRDRTRDGRRATRTAQSTKSNQVVSVYGTRYAPRPSGAGGRTAHRTRHCALGSRHVASVARRVGRPGTERSRPGGGPRRETADTGKSESEPGRGLPRGSTARGAPPHPVTSRQPKREVPDHETTRHVTRPWTDRHGPRAPRRQSRGHRTSSDGPAAARGRCSLAQVENALVEVVASDRHHEPLERLLVGAAARGRGHLVQVGQVGDQDLVHVRVRVTLELIL